MKIKVMPKKDFVGHWLFEEVKEAHNAKVIDYCTKGEGVIYYIIYEINEKIKEKLINECGLRYEIID